MVYVMNPWVNIYLYLTLFYVSLSLIFFLYWHVMKSSNIFLIKVTYLQLIHSLSVWNERIKNGVTINCMECKCILIRLDRLPIYSLNILHCDTRYTHTATLNTHIGDPDLSAHLTLEESRRITWYAGLFVAFLALAFGSHSAVDRRSRSACVTRLGCRAQPTSTLTPLNHFALRSTSSSSEMIGKHKTITPRYLLLLFCRLLYVCAVYLI
jgi:hypothetical protein